MYKLIYLNNNLTLILLIEFISINKKNKINIYLFHLLSKTTLKNNLYLSNIEQIYNTKSINKEIKMN